MLMKVAYSDGDVNLLKVAQACRESKFRDRFTMHVYEVSCGTPGCAIGNYVVRHDLHGDSSLSLRWLMQSTAGVTFDWMEKHFSISRNEAHSLFGPYGCDSAETPEQAADFIEDFVAERVANRVCV